MASLPESSTFDAGVYQLELTDPVIGGPSGVSNTPLKNLANRTKYLKDHVDALEATRAPLASPALTGTPTAPTAAAGTNTTQLATTAFVKAAVDSGAQAMESTATNIKMNGTQSAGSLATAARGDHVHPTDTSRAPLASPAFTGAPTAPTPSAGDNSTKLATTAFVQSELSNSVPAGAVIYTAMNAAPTGYLKANGAAVSRTTYAALFAAIGTTFGAGNGSTTFNLPDLRGEFIRGWDDARGIDAARAFGSSQADQFQGHGHELLYKYTGAYGTGGLSTSLDTTSNSGILANMANDPTSLSGFGTARFGSETRPRNLAMLACIKF